MPELERFASSLALDARLWRFDVAGSLAHARGLAGAGIITEARLRAIERGLRRVAREFELGKFRFLDTDEDIHTAVERRLTEITPAGASLHAGRSRNDQVALDLRLYTRATAAQAVGELGRLVTAIAAQARRHASWVMPGYTHLQRAQPVTLGHHLMAHAEPLLRDARRFEAAYAAADEMPLGSGALAASTLPLARETVAKQLGFSRLTANSIDAVSDRDFALDLAHACLSTALHLSRLGEDVVLWASAEFGFVKLPDTISTGSSLMPQKRNPDIAELLRARAGRAAGALVALAMVLKGLPLAYDRDLQEDKPALFAAADSVLESLAAARELVTRLEFDRARLSAVAADEALLATDAAEALVRTGTPFRRAHEAISKLHSQGHLTAPWSARTSLQRRDLPGAPHPRQVAARARAAGREAAELERWSRRHPPALPI